LRGEAAGTSGVWKKRKVVGPNDGKTIGARATCAAVAITAMPTKPVTRVNAADNILVRGRAERSTH